MLHILQSRELILAVSTIHFLICAKISASPFFLSFPSSPSPRPPYLALRLWHQLPSMIFKASYKLLRYHRTLSSPGINVHSPNRLRPYFPNRWKQSLWDFFFLTYCFPRLVSSLLCVAYSSHSSRPTCIYKSG